MSWSCENLPRGASLPRHDDGHAAVGLDVGVEDAQRGVPALDRHADGLADVVIDDRLRGAEPLVRRRVGGDHPLPLLEHVIDDRSRDGHPLVGVGGIAPADGLGHEVAALVLQQDGASVGPDRLEDELENLGQERVDLEDMADRLGGPVHDREADQPLAEPSRRALGLLEDARALARGNAPEDGRAVVGTAPAQQVDPRRQVAPGAGDSLVVEQDRLAELEPVSRVERRLVDELAVDVGPVGRAEIDDPVRLLLLPELGMAAGDLGIVEPDRVRVIPSQGHGTRLELEALALVGPLDHKQGGHEVVSPWRIGDIPRTQKLDLNLTDEPPSVNRHGTSQSPPVAPPVVSHCS